MSVRLLVRGLPAIVAVVTCCLLVETRDAVAQLNFPPRPRFGLEGLKVPEGDDVSALVKFLEETKRTRTKGDDEYTQLLKLTKSAADRILDLEKDKTSATYQMAQQESLLAEAKQIRDLNPAEIRAAFARVKDYLKDRPVAGYEANLALTTARELERTSQTELAVEAYESFGRSFARSDIPQIRQASEMMTGAVRRLTLIGKPLELSGTTLGGMAFDVQTFKGKVVLVDYWATWCAPCRVEIPNIKTAYEKYHDRGFEVVGVNLDEQRADAEAFVQEQAMPWTNLFQEGGTGRHPSMNHYGIFAIPAMFLIGRDGNVISIRARGQALQEALAKEFADGK